MYEYELPFRPNFESAAYKAWIGASAASLTVTALSSFPPTLGIVAGLLCLAPGYVRWQQAAARNDVLYRIDRATVREFITPEEMRSITQQAVAAGALWLGKGFSWTDIEANFLHAVLSEGPSKLLGKRADNTDGNAWIHALAEEQDIHTALANLVGHTLVSGTTRVGKTRLFDLLIQQAVFRNECVIIIDPKGDHGLPEHAKYACELMGEPERFIYFHPAHPEKSAAIDPLRNWNRRTEVASRIAALIPSETGADPFAAFGWKVINDITNGLISIGQRPNLVELRGYIEGGADHLVEMALRTHFEKNITGWEKRVAEYLKKAKGGPVEGYVRFYEEAIQHECPALDIEGLISTYKHNRDHFSKMVASLIPIMSMLTSDPLKDLISPTVDTSSRRVVTDMAKIIRQRKVAYLGLDSLADGTVGSAIGSIMLADLTAVAGDRYNYSLDESIPVNIFVDEAAEVINQPTIQLMNKAGGANFRITVATQTFADFATRLGSKEKATQVLANANNKITLRVLDLETQKYFTDGMPPFMAKRLNVRYGHSSHANLEEEFAGSYAESLTENEVQLFPPALLGELPPLHFVARLSGEKIFKERIPILEIKRG